MAPQYPWPKLAYGTGSVLGKAADDGTLDVKTVEHIQKALKLGYTHIDCAEAYNNEREVGAAIQQSQIAREKLFVTTKTLGFQPIAQALDASLQKLQLSYVDLYLLHIPWLEPTRSLRHVWAEMEAVKASGKAKAIGVSNFAISHLETIKAGASEIPAVNQVEYNIYLQQSELSAYCQRYGITIEAYGPLAPCITEGPAKVTVGELARKYGVGEAEICLRWCVQKGVVVVTTSLKEERVKGYLTALEFSLEDEEIEQLSSVGASHHFRKYFAENFAGEDKA
ncbi:hypothetical protein BPOR_0809g00040 [Botrytis porri]|uniref:NADP-dependent oxidoreductase domain-containing protein n=1 Tax=Botrytis porri TaxID=87229 RepID=A0A4Z1K8W0_9HELO|nr:hypothetical protein BPOR_0809g00040 [Botrytis porri]